MAILMSKVNGKREVYHIKKVRELIVEVERLLTMQPTVILDSQSSHIIIRNLVEGLKASVNTVEYLNNRIEAQKLHNATAISDARN